MAKYNFSTINENAEFLDFAQKEYGYNSAAEIPEFEKYAIFYKFRAENNDVEPENFEDFEKNKNAQYEEELTNIYYPGKKYNELENKDRIFVNAMTLDIGEKSVPPLSEIKKHAQIRRDIVQKNAQARDNAFQEDEFVISEIEDIENGQENVMTSSSGTNPNGPDDSNSSVNSTFPGEVNDDIPPSDAPENISDETPQGGVVINEEPQDITKNHEILHDNIDDEGLRKRSSNSDKNEFLMDVIKLEALKDMKIINDQLFQAAIKNPTTAIDAIQKSRELNPKEQLEFEDLVAEKMMKNDELFVAMPPKFLAKRYEHLNQKVAADLQANPNADVTKENQDINKLEERMDDLSSQLAQDIGFYFGDVTNIGDTYEGYNLMFDTREKYLANNQKAPQIKQDIAKGREVMSALIKEYDGEWNIENVQAADAVKLSNRFDDLKNILPGISLDDEAMKLASNFKFLDDKGQIEPQFLDSNGKPSAGWQQGYKVAPNSKLEAVINITKQNYMMQDLNSTKAVDPIEAQKEISELLPETLFAFHVSDKTVQGALEHPKEFTDKKHLLQFVTQLGNIEKPMQITNIGYEAGLDSSINAAAAFADRLGSKIGRNKSAALKVIDNLNQYDKRAKDRTEGGKVSKREIRIEMLKRMAKNGTSAFLVSGAITVIGAATAADASLTAATLGMNKVAGAALATTLAVTMVTRNIMHWRKERKKNGQKTGLWSMIKEPRLMSSVATTALGASALGFAMAGNPAIAAGLGYSAMAVGIGSGIVFTAKDSVKAGLSGWEATGWAALQAVVTAGAAYTGRVVGNAGVDLYNKHNSDNDLFQHKEKIGSHMEKDGTETIVDYPKVEQNAEKFLENNWYKDHPELLDSRIEALTAAGVPNPHHALLIAHDASLQAPDNMAMYDGTTSNGNHTVMTKIWAEQAGVSFDDVKAMGNLFSADGSVNPDAIKAYQNLAPHVGEDNFITRMDPRPVIRELYGDRESTYDHDGKMPTKEIDKFREVDDFGMARNNSDLGYGMLGFLTSPLKAAKKLKDRIGSFMDRIIKKQKKIKPPVEIIPPVVITPPEEIIPPIIIIEPKKPEFPNDKLLLDEYKIVYGIEPNMEPGKDKVWKDYCNRVEEERKIEAPKMSTNEFLLARRKTLDDVIANTVPGQTTQTDAGQSIRKDYLLKQAKDERGKAGVIMEARQSLMQSNLTKDNFNHKITLSHFTKYLPHVIKKDNVASDGSRDVSLNPEFKKNGKAVILTDLNQYLVEGKPLAKETVQYRVSMKDAKSEMSELKKNAERKSARE